MEEQPGLYDKYTICKTASGEAVKEAFVLLPEKDKAAREALKTYADFCQNENPILASDIRWWIALIEVENDTPEEKR